MWLNYIFKEYFNNLQVLLKEIQEKTKKGEIREDDKFKGKDELQKMIDDYSVKIEELVDRKKREIEVD